MINVRTVKNDCKKAVDFFCLLFTFRKTVKFSGSTKMDIFTGKRLKSRRFYRKR